MSHRFGTRWQLALVALLFLGSLGTLLFNTLALFGLPQREAEARRQTGAAGRRLAESARPVLAESAPGLGRRLTELTEAALADLPGAEGGLYLAGDRDEFTGYAFPTRPEEKGKGKAPPARDPPPLERPYIRAQAQQSLHREPGAPPLVQVYDVNNRRVVVATEPIGMGRPARAVAWAMIRLTGPEQQRAALGRYRVSTALAYGAILLAFVLTANLGRTLRRERGQRERMREELRRAERLAALGQMLAGVAHEVRNPLAGIRSTVQLWQRLPDVARTPQSLEAMVQAVDRLDGLVGRLLYFARTDADESRPVDLNAAVRDTLELLRAQAAGQGVTLETDLADGLPAVTGSDAALRQVVLNLAANALQAMPKGGRLRCETRSGKGGVVLRVADTGPGVLPAARGRLFEPFFTTRPDGTGLGLALCREIVEQHGGRIVLEDGPGPGAVFRVELPAEQKGASV